jgi:hypothetical protein
MLPKSWRTSLLVLGAAATVFAGARPRVAFAQTEAPEVPESAAPTVRSGPRPAPAAEPPPKERPKPVHVNVAPPAIEPPPPAARTPVAQQPAEAVIAATSPAAALPPAWTVTPGARLEFDGGQFHGGPPAALLVRRARLQATGWIGAWTYFSAAAEYAAPPGQPALFSPTDVLLAVSPLGPLLTLQAGQFDAPFSLENRTVDYALDFLERSIAIRALGVPENKATGAMLTGTDDALRFHYALGVFAGDGPALRSLDGQFDFMARAWLAPFAFTGVGPLRAVSFGGSFWIGDRANALPLDPQTTTGGLTFARFDPYTTTAGGPPRQLRQVGRRIEAAGELEAPVTSRFGARAEVVWRRSPLSEEDVTSPTRPTILGGGDLQGWAAYGQAWLWVLGDERSAPIVRHGLEPVGVRTLDPAAPDGIMLALRVSHLDEEVWLETDAALLNLRDPSVGVTQVTSYELAVNYWHARAFRATGSFIVNQLSGTTPEVRSLGTSTEEELLLRLAFAL